MVRYMTYALLGLKGALLAWGVMGFYLLRSPQLRHRFDVEALSKPA